jgi:hypothetical protein
VAARGRRARAAAPETALVLTAGRVSAARETGPQGVLLRIAGWTGADEAFSSSVDVRDRVLPTVAEILARHQVWAARQERRLERVVSHGSTLLTFQVPGLAAPMTVTAGMTLFRAGRLVEMVMHDLRLNGTRWRWAVTACPASPSSSPIAPPRRRWP